MQWNKTLVRLSWVSKNLDGYTARQKNYKPWALKLHTVVTARSWRVWSLEFQLNVQVLIRHNFRYMYAMKTSSTRCSDVDGRRTSLKIPFRQHVPREALASIIDVRTICPDATHMITRCTENDNRRVAQKVINDKHPWEALSIQRFEKNLTSREAKRPSSQFNITHKNVDKTPGTVGPLSLAGSNALTVIAETE